jgi:diaminohydroxyphosphoribosylaminopyrimidine deaminase / 5-amino-6-(5-phosphoribosylamino)uracil reductase
VALTERNRTDQDHLFLRRALALAERGLGLAAPNPKVGAVVVGPAGEVVGEGWHQGPGTAHAEIVALEQAGERAGGATLYVTLEPCSHQGRTGPCAPVVVQSGVRRVVVPITDPNPEVGGGGLRILQESGIEVDVGLLAVEAGDLIAGFAKHVLTGLPFVTLKMAASLDGKVAARDGSSRWVSGPEARRDAHRLRAAAGAIVVGAGTAVADDPALTIRLEDYEGRPPVRILVDGSGRTPTGGALFDASAPTWVATTTRANRAAVDRWREAGSEVLTLGEDRVSLPSLMREIGAAGIQDVLIEGGANLAWSAIDEGVVDRFVVYLAPKLIGGTGALGVLAGEGVRSIAEAVPVEIRSVQRIGEDLKVVADVHRDR